MWSPQGFQSVCVIMREKIGEKRELDKMHAVDVESTTTITRCFIGAPVTCR
jgi:hypothetical protein